MKAVIAIDSLKGSLSSLQAGDAIRTGILRVYKDAVVQVRPLADGGEGTVEALTIGMGGELQTVSVTGPLGKKLDAQYGILADGVTAILEMSAAAGITLVEDAERNPLHTTTYGVGEMIRDAIGKGCRHFIVGIGGSATNDGGIGMLQALGYGLLNEAGEQVSFGAKGLEELSRITTDGVLTELKDCSFRIACDLQMDKWLKAYAKLAQEIITAADREFPGTGAAGGLGFAFLSFTNAVLESGIKIVLEETRLEEYVKDADIVITGEGRLDGQTVMGKAPIGVAKIAKKYLKPVVAFAGCVTPDAVKCNEHGIDAFFPILRGVVTLSEAMDSANAHKNMADTVEQVFRLLAIK